LKSTKENDMLEKNIDETNENLRLLLANAAQFFATCATEYAEQLPTDSAVYGALWKAGKCVPSLRLVLTDRPAVECGYQYGAEWVKFFSWQPPKPASDTLN
jgi:hypothetical protein